MADELTPFGSDTNLKGAWTPEQLCIGFGNCKGTGKILNPANVNGAMCYLDTKINELAAAAMPDDDSEFITATIDGVDSAGTPYAVGDPVLSIDGGGFIAVASLAPEIAPAVTIDGTTVTDDPNTWPALVAPHKKQCVYDAAGNLVGMIDANGGHPIKSSASIMKESADGCFVQQFDGQNVATGPELVMRNEDQSGTFYLQVNIPTIPDSDLQLIAAATGWVEVGTVELDYDNESACRDMSSMFVTRGGNPQFVYNSGGGDDVANEPFFQVRYRAISGGLPTPIIGYDFSGKDDQSRIYFPTQTEPDGEVTLAGGSGSIGYAIDIQITELYIPNPLNRISLFVNRIHGLWALK